VFNRIIMKNLFIITVVLAGMTACNEAPKENAAHVNQNGVEQQQAKEIVVEANRLLIMEIDGMVCQMGCGGTIRKELKATGGVSNCEFDFEDERATNTAKIAFDKDKITVDEIVKIVSTINDNQFSVGKTSSEDVHDISTHVEKHRSESTEKANIEVSSSTIEIPNLLDLLSGLFI